MSTTIMLWNKYHAHTRTFRLPKRTQGVFGLAYYLSRKASKKWLCDPANCKCQDTIRCVTTGYYLLGVDNGRIVIEMEI